MPPKSPLALQYPEGFAGTFPWEEPGCFCHEAGTQQALPAGPVKLAKLQCSSPGPHVPYREPPSVWMGRALTEAPATGSKRGCQGSCGGICLLSEQGYSLDSLELTFLILGHMQKNLVPSWQPARAAEQRGLGKAPEEVCACTSALDYFVLKAAQTQPGANAGFCRGWEPRTAPAGWHPPPRGAFPWGPAPTEADPPSPRVLPGYSCRPGARSLLRGPSRGGMGQR